MHGAKTVATRSAAIQQSTDRDDSHTPIVETATLGRYGSCMRMHLSRLLSICLLVAGLSAQVQDPTPRSLVVATKEAPPFVIRQGQGWTGLSIELWRMLEAKLGVQTTFKERSLEDMLNDTATGEVDLAIAAITVTPDREELMEFTHPYLSSGLGIATRARDEGLIAALMARLFSADLLSAVFALGLVLGVCGLLIWLLERRANPEQFGGKGLTGPGNGFWFSAVTMTTVGYGDKSPVTFGGRLVALVWMFASIMIISGYTAAIASALTTDRMAAVIRGKEDLPSARVGTLDNSSAAEWLEDRRIAFTDYPDLAAAIDSLEIGTLDAVVYDAPILKSLIRDDSKSQVLPQVLRHEQYSIALPPNSPLRKELNRALLEVIESEAWVRLRERYLGN